jgi:glycosyltransferase involved in cell wall biosynthesis
VAKYAAGSDGSHRGPSSVNLVSIFGAPAPYTTPVLNALAERLELHVVYLSERDRVSHFRDSWGVAPEFSHSVHWARRLDAPSIGLHVEWSFGVAALLNKLSPDAILLVSWKPTVLEPLLWSRWRGSAAVMWAESTPFSGLLRDPVSTRIRRALTQAFDGYVSNGSQATRYLMDLGVASERIVTSALPAAMSPHALAPRRQAGAAIRFLFVGRLIPQKRPLELIEAFRVARDAVPDATLTLVGEGDLEAEVREAALRSPGVSYEGRREGAELAALYSASDVLVMPALREVWGIVVNEALAHGLFVVATDQVGSAHDLLGDTTGIVLPAEDLGRLAPTLVDVGRTLDMSDAARRRRATAVADCTPERFADDITRAVEIAARVRANRWRARHAATSGSRRSR